jgi:hypothetical protein
MYWEYLMYYDKTQFRLRVAIRVATIDLLLINEHESQWGMQAKKKKKLISRMCVAKWVDRSTLMKISP